ncbi:unnamed protein product [Linum trigynum]|uniref:Protein FAR1-RELATED SEQUENCE n=1 Tax=Linum trigynum TaxID=586398 RepID=A0AAV2F7W0_9ROSI
MKFDGDDSAYEFYKAYAHNIGFSVKKRYVKRTRAGHVERRTFCCSKEGKKGFDKRRENVAFERPVKRIDCLAQMTCQLKKDGLLEIVSFEANHNHDLAPTPMKHAELDDDDLVLNMFWDDGRSIIDYKYFGDVICFDTYRTNEYGRPFAPFVGVNHLKQTVISGAALLYDETISSFKWLFEAFLGAMAGKQPKTILTDQSAAMAKAIEEVLAHKVKHRRKFQVNQRSIDDSREETRA